MASIVLTVQGAKWETFKKYFLIAHPNQTHQMDVPMSDDDWIKHRIRLFAQNSYLRGLKNEYDELHGPVIDPNIVT